MKIIQFFLLLFVLGSFTACNNDDDEVTAEIDHHLVAQGTTTSGKKVKLWSDDASLTVSYNRLYVSVQNSDSTYIGDQAVTLTPVMDMMTMKHSSPVTQPVFNSSTKLYEGGAVFSMPSGDMGSWQVIVTMGEEQVALNVSVDATATGIKHTGTFVGSDGVSYTISLVEPVAPKIGMNDLVIMINKRETLMSFPAVSGLTVEVTPEMPSMGHGSPNNVNPVYTTGGLYVGKVNFTMTGDWRLHFKVLNGSTVITEDFSLDLLF